MFVEITDYVLFLVELQVTSYKLNFKIASYQKFLQVKIRKCALLEKIASFLKNKS